MNVRFNIPWGEVVTFIHVVKLYANESFILVCCKYMIKTPRLRGFFSFENIINVDKVMLRQSRDVATSQGMLADPRSWKSQEKDSPLEPSEAWCC